MLRLVDNSHSGFYSDEWVRFGALLELLQPSEPLTSSSLQPLFEGRSVNTSGFLLAVLKHLGVVKPMDSNPRCHELADVAALVAELQALIDSPVSLGLNARPGTARGRRKGIAMAAADGVGLDS